jgi:hypothetical protein
MASQGRSWDGHFRTKIGDKPLVANSFPSARLLKNGEVISLFFGSGSRYSTRVRGSEKSRNRGGLLRIREYRTPTAGQPFLDQGAKCRPGYTSRLSRLSSAFHSETAEDVPGRPGMLISVPCLSGLGEPSESVGMTRWLEMGLGGWGGQNLGSSPFVSHLWLKTNLNNVGYEEFQLDGQFVG